MAAFSKSQIDRLGERLKIAPISEQDLRMLDEYRRSFRAAYEEVIKNIRDESGLQATGRPAKSTTSIVAKLLREHVRLTQIQDIAGCRIVVADLGEQDRVVALLRSSFPEVNVVDRRSRPSHGYRAVHVIPGIAGKRIEIQVRTRLQHLWAESSERFADFLGPELKYGGGPAEAREVLDSNSRLVRQLEDLQRRAAELDAHHEPEPEIAKQLTDLEIALTDNLARLISVLTDLGRSIE